MGWSVHLKWVVRYGAQRATSPVLEGCQQAGAENQPTQSLVIVSDF